MPDEMTPLVLALLEIAADRDPHLRGTCERVRAYVRERETIDRRVAEYELRQREHRKDT